MSVARYTERLMNQLVNDGECFEPVGWVSMNVARSRIQNAAFRLRMVVRTEWDPAARRVWGYEKKD